MSDRIGQRLFVICDNLSDSDRQMFSSVEKRVSHIRDMAFLFSDEIRRISGTASVPVAILQTDNARIAFEGIIPDRRIDTSCAECNADYVGAMSHEISRDEMLIFCRELCKNDKTKLTALIDCLIGMREEPTAAERKIAILRSGQAGAAFEKFARNIFGVGAVYGDNFQTLCEAVSRSEVMYAVIPVENSSDGRLNGIHRIMEKYDLFTVMSCDITAPDDVMTRFALVGKRLELLDAEGTETFEFRLTFGNISDIADILTAVRFFGADTVSMSSIPGDYSGGKFAYAFVLNVNNADIPSLLVWLKLNYSQFIPVGIYRHIGENL